MIVARDGFGSRIMRVAWPDAPSGTPWPTVPRRMARRCARLLAGVSVAWAMGGPWGVTADGSGPAAGAGDRPAAAAELDSRTRRILAAADDDTDRIGEPVAVLLDLVRFASPPGEAAGRGPSAARLDRDAILADPDRWRGRRVSVSGRLEQVAPRPAAGDDVREWFIRTDDGPVAVLVVGGPVVRPGRLVEADAWFVRRAAVEGRDGVRRVHPLLVAVPGGVIAGSAHEPSGDLPLLVFAAAALLGTAVFARRLRRVNATRTAAAAAGRATRMAGPGRGDRRGGATRSAAAPDTLPGDAAEALAALRTRGAVRGGSCPEPDAPGTTEEDGRQR